MGLRYQPLAACMNVTRASTKLARGPSGLLEARALDEPAYDHDAVGRRLGLLIEGAATNLLRYSNAFENALWEEDSGVSVTSSTIAAPDGSETAMQLDLPGSSGGADGLYQNVGGLVASEVYSFAV